MRKGVGAGGGDHLAASLSLRLFFFVCLGGELLLFLVRGLPHLGLMSLSRLIFMGDIEIAKMQRFAGPLSKPAESRDRGRSLGGGRKY